MYNKNLLDKILIQIIRFAAFILTKTIFWKRKQRIWLIACGDERWGDNAAAFWRYMNDNHPDIKTVAVLKNKACVNFPDNNWVKRNSWSNYIMILTAEVLATTHTLSDIGPEIFTSVSKAKKVWLQHGVIAIGKITAINAKMGKYDLICASSKQEKKIMTDTLGINSEIIQTTGLARHDIILDRIKDKRLPREGIFYLPTSRVWLDINYKEEYEKMLFTWVNEINNIEIKLWLHPGWYKVGLGKLGSEYKSINNYGLDQDPQNILLRSSLLITDYSSVFFDAALSGIPTIFYQPDRAMYIKEKGLINDFLEQNVLLVTESREGLLLLIDKIMEDKDYYRERVQSDQQWAYKYVESFDGNCSKRTYQQIKKLL